MPLLGGSFSWNPGCIGGMGFAHCMLRSLSTHACGIPCTVGHRVIFAAYSGGMIEYTAFRNAMSRGSPVIPPIWLVTYA